MANIYFWKEVLLFVFPWSVTKSACSFCLYYALPHIWLCLLVFVWRPTGWSLQGPALALSQARLQQLSQSLHNTKHYTGMLLPSCFPPPFFLGCFFSLSLTIFCWVPTPDCLCLSHMSTWICPFLPQCFQVLVLSALQPIDCNCKQIKLLLLIYIIIHLVSMKYTQRLSSQPSGCREWDNL